MRRRLATFGRSGSRAAVTVNVPAWRAGDFIAQTLASIQAQSFTDFVVEVGIEPDGGDATAAACRPFRSDRRFRFHRNPTTLGWDGHVRALLQRVETPYFVVLPHDDQWHPAYLAALMEAIRDRPDASVAYADCYVFGEGSGIKTMDLPDAPLPERLLAFFLAGGGAFAWRGLTRRDVLDCDFPGNPYNGFAVEVEWALHLLTRGVALRVPQPLYLKRARVDEESVSVGWRFSMPVDMVTRALEHHRARQLAMIRGAGLADEDLRTVERAAESAIMIRWAVMSRGRIPFTGEQLERIDGIIAACRREDTPVSRMTAGKLHLALSRDAFGRRDRDAERDHAVAAVELAPTSVDAVLHLARLHVRARRVMDALPLVRRAAAIAPMAAGISPLQRDIADALNERSPLTR
jgi:hypothetical protein